MKFVLPFTAFLALLVAPLHAAAPKADDAVAGTASWWMPRHEAVKKALAGEKPQLLLIGDSITHWWGGVPDIASKKTGEAVYEHYFGARHAVNLGFASDRCYELIWRLKNGELTGVSPKVAVVMIGTNDSPTPGFTPDQTAGAIREICGLIHKAAPATKILLLGIFPRDRIRTPAFIGFPAQVNRRLAKLDGHDGIVYLNLNDKLGNPGGTCRAGLFIDGVHPNAAGYAVWAAAMEPTLAKLFGDTPVEPMPEQ